VAVEVLELVAGEHANRPVLGPDHSFGDQAAWRPRDAGRAGRLAAQSGRRRPGLGVEDSWSVTSRTTPLQTSRARRPFFQVHTGRLISIALAMVDARRCCRSISA